MTRRFKGSEKTGLGDVLDFLQQAAEAGDDAVVPADSLSVLTRSAECRPMRRGPYAGCFLFCFSRPVRVCSGWGSRLLALVALLVLSPLLLSLAGAVWLADGSPVLFWQTRYGAQGKPFCLIKFRTMKRRAETLHDKLQRRRGTEDRLFKLTDDPRVTRLGGFLRQTFLDELPQVANVLRGEMAFIGPRPLPESDNRCYTRPAHALRFRGLPGLTGLWQVSGRHALSFDEMCLLDIYLLCNRSAALNARILLRTFRLLFSRSGR